MFKAARREALRTGGVRCHDTRNCPTACQLGVHKFSFTQVLVAGKTPLQKVGTTFWGSSGKPNLSSTKTLKSEDLLPNSRGLTFSRRCAEGLPGPSDPRRPGAGPSTRLRPSRCLAAILVAGPKPWDATSMNQFDFNGRGCQNQWDPILG